MTNATSMSTPLPPIPQSMMWADVLHWCVCVMDIDDPDLAFTASLLSQAIKYDGISAKQGQYGQRIFDRLRTLYERQELSAQVAARTALATLPPAGNA
jgi:hypothetical protein